MPRTNEATDTDLKVIDPVRKFFSNGVERLTQQLGWKRGDTCSINRSMLLVQNIKKCLRDGKV